MCYYMIDSVSSYPFIQSPLIKPRLVEPLLVEHQLVERQLVEIGKFKSKNEHGVLKKLLRDSYNEGDRPFIQIIGKYTVNAIHENWFYILIIVLILIIVFIRMNKKEKVVEKKEEELYVKKKPSKYTTPNEYYTNVPRINNNELSHKLINYN